MSVDFPRDLGPIVRSLGHLLHSVTSCTLFYIQNRQKSPKIANFELSYQRRQCSNQLENWHAYRGSHIETALSFLSETSDLLGRCSVAPFHHIKLEFKRSVRS